MVHDRISRDKMNVMKLVGLLLALASISVAAAADKAQDKPQVQGKLLDRNGYLCQNCFFGASTYYFCFEADSKVLIGYEKIPTMNWADPSANWLTKVHKSWQPGLSPGQLAEGQPIPLRYDDKYIWITGASGKQVRLTQDYSTDIFVGSQQCRAAVKKK
jgi:hypothetical protein